MEAEDENTRLVCVSCPTHHEMLVSVLWHFVTSQHRTDLEFQCDGRSIRAHQVVVEVFLSPEKLGALDQRFMQGADPHGSYLESLLEFLYNGRVSVQRGNLDNLLQVARELDFKMLVEAVELAQKEAEAPKTLDEPSPDSWSPRLGRGRRKGVPMKLSATDETDLDTDDSWDLLPPRKARTRRVTRGGGGPRKRKPPVPVGPPSSPSLSDDAVAELSETARNVSEEPRTQGDEEGTPGARTRGIRRSYARKARTLDVRTAALAKTEYKKMWRRSQPLLRCDQCSYSNRCKKSLKVHMAKHDPAAVPLFRCSECSKAFFSAESMELHKTTRHSGPPAVHMCPHCSYNSPKARNLRSHLHTTHKMDENGVPLPNTLACSECSFTCAYRSQLKHHLRIRHTGEKPFVCHETADCNYASTRKGDLDKHIKVMHRHERPFMCDTCGYKAANQGVLIKHQRTHSGEKPFVCEICDMVYAHSSRLKIHLQRHYQPDEKPFCCHICGYACRRRDNLQMHMKRIHKAALDDRS